MSTLLRVENLGIEFGALRATEGVSFEMAEGETLAVVGESGSGKSVTALALTRLLATPPAGYVSGSIQFEGREVLALPQDELRALRGKQIAYIFQEPSSSLNPVFTIEYQIREAIELHRPEVRDVRGEFLRLSSQPFPQAARALGASDFRVIVRHLLPNALGPIMVSATFGVASAILLESSLSFLGFGMQAPTPSWGDILSDARRYIDFAWWLAFFPGVAILITVVSYNFVGEGLRDAVDPRLKVK